MGVEQGRRISRSDQIIHRFLFTDLAPKLAASDVDTLTLVKQALKTFPKTENVSLMERLLRGAVTDREEVKRKAAGQLIRKINYFPEQGTELRDTLLTIAKSQQEREDLQLADIDVLLLAGQTLVPYFEGNKTKQEIGNAFMPLVDKLGDHKSWKSVAVRVFELQQRIGSFNNPSTEPRLPSQVLRRMIILTSDPELTRDWLLIKLNYDGVKIYRKELDTHLAILAKQGIKIPLKEAV